MAVTMHVQIFVRHLSDFLVIDLGEGGGTTGSHRNSIKELKELPDSSTERLLPTFLSLLFEAA